MNNVIFFVSLAFNVAAILFTLGWFFLILPEWKTRIDTMGERLDCYKQLSMALYQMAGVCDAPVRFLDALSDAQHGRPGYHYLNLLPVMPEEFGKNWNEEDVVKAIEKLTPSET